MRKFLTMFAALLMAVGLMVPAYAAETNGTDPGEYTESQQYVYLAQGANLYLGPDTSYEVYATAEINYNEQVVISGTYSNGWARFQRENSNLWLYVAPESLIWDEADVYSKEEYENYVKDSFKAMLPMIVGILVAFVLSFVAAYLVLDEERPLAIGLIFTVIATGCNGLVLYFTGTLLFLAYSGVILPAAYLGLAIRAFKSRRKNVEGAECEEY